MTTTPGIEIAELTKSYGDNAVLTGVDLSVPPGAVVALLGFPALWCRFSC